MVPYCARYNSVHVRVVMVVYTCSAVLSSQYLIGVIADISRVHVQLYYRLIAHVLVHAQVRTLLNTQLPFYRNSYTRTC